VADSKEKIKYRHHKYTDIKKEQVHIDMYPECWTHIYELG